MEKKQNQKQCPRGRREFRILAVLESSLPLDAVLVGRKEGVCQLPLWGILSSLKQKTRPPLKNHRDSPLLPRSSLNSLECIKERPSKDMPEAGSFQPCLLLLRLLLPPSTQRPPFQPQPGFPSFLETRCSFLPPFPFLCSVNSSSRGRTQMPPPPGCPRELLQVEFVTSSSVFL